MQEWFVPLICHSVFLKMFSLLFYFVWNICPFPDMDRNWKLVTFFLAVCLCSSCLRSWLEQDTSCPTCRTSLNINGDGGQVRNQQQGAGLEDNIGPAGAAPDARPHINQHNHFFHFDGKCSVHKSNGDLWSDPTLWTICKIYAFLS